ncbi:unnamed protein product [Callosobruchus maculatus]|uniref:Uncharacterized protein n=1 Tax=Callosobruchus maculatus TaxID=64391 RepID=A0A653DD53_CALMS|nr:unnamed protein product [Callosobruchus maculatus]
MTKDKYKAKKPLYCYKCDTAKKSVIGYLSHQSQCGVHENDAKIPCAQCGRKVLPVSMPVHIKMRYVDYHNVFKRKFNRRYIKVLRRKSRIY